MVIFANAIYTDDMVMFIVTIWIIWSCRTGHIIIHLDGNWFIIPLLFRVYP